MHNALIIVWSAKHRYASKKLLKVDVGVLLDVGPVHFDVFVAFTVNCKQRGFLNENPTANKFTLLYYRNVRIISAAMYNTISGA